MCQTRCGESRLKTASKGVAVNKITNKYLKIGSTVIEAVEPFPYVCEFCCKIEQLREECRLLSKSVITLFSFFACFKNARAPPLWI